MLKQTHVCGPWEMKERLGTGGFGDVYMYQHQVSHEYTQVTLRLQVHFICLLRHMLIMIFGEAPHFSTGINYLYF